jgi:hypothetical protein
LRRGHCVGGLRKRTSADSSTKMRMVSPGVNSAFPSCSPPTKPVEIDGTEARRARRQRLILATETPSCAAAAPSTARCRVRDCGRRAEADVRTACPEHELYAVQRGSAPALSRARTPRSRRAPGDERPAAVEVSIPSPRVTNAMPRACKSSRNSTRCRRLRPRRSRRQPTTASIVVGVPAVRCSAVQSAPAQRDPVGRFHELLEH